MPFTRSAGILLHPTSLPGPDGIGDLGPEAYRWVNFLAESGCSLWQILPLGPTGYGDSPYQCFSAFAGNPFLVSPALLLEDGLLTSDDLADRPDFPPDRVDYGPVIQWKLTLLDRAFKRFKRSSSQKRKAAFEEFQAANADWLPDFALFMAIKESQGGVSWDNWPAPLRNRDPAALEAFSAENADSIQRHIFRQFLFFRQWKALHEYTNDKGIQIIGDVPIFVAYRQRGCLVASGSVLLRQRGQTHRRRRRPAGLFLRHRPIVGQPALPLGLSPENRLCLVDRARESRPSAVVDIIRLDHFRGFAAYWEIPYGDADRRKRPLGARPGHRSVRGHARRPGQPADHRRGPGRDHPGCDRDARYLGLPGMKILQFAFAADPEDLFLPHNYVRNCVAYTGTHDNDTSLGWYSICSGERTRPGAALPGPLRR